MCCLIEESVDMAGSYKGNNMTPCTAGIQDILTCIFHINLYRVGKQGRIIRYIDLRKV